MLSLTLKILAGLMAALLVLLVYFVCAVAAWGGHRLVTTAELHAAAGLLLLGVAAGVVGWLLEEGDSGW